MSQIFDSIVNGMMDTIKSASSDKTSAYSTDAVVRRIDGGTAWVHIDRGADETPVELTIDAKVGDTVKVNVSGGRAWIIGNSTAPPTDDTKANGAYIKAESAEGKAVDAALLAEKAGKVAANTNQYFWVTKTGTDTGAHVTEIPQSEFLSDPENGGGNLLARSNGIAVRDGLDELASFTSTSAQVGGSDSGHAVVSSAGMQIYGSDGSTQLANIGFGSTQDDSGTTDAPYYSLGTRAAGNIGKYSVTGGEDNLASTPSAIALGKDNTAGGGSFSVAIGGHNIATMFAAIAIGAYNQITGSSYALGRGLKTSDSRQVLLGEYNATPSINDLLILGCGTSDSTRKTVMKVDENGNITANNNAPLQSSGNWRYKKYPNGTFEAWYNVSSTVTLQTGLSGATGWYRNSGNPLYQLTVPSAIGTATVMHADVHAITGLAGMYATVTDISNDTVTYYVIYSGQLSSRSATITAYVFGTWV